MDQNTFKIIYYTILCVSYLLALMLPRNKRYGNLPCWVLIIFISIFIGYRGLNVGTDTENYKIIFNEFKEFKFDELSYFLEFGKDPLFRIIMWVCYQLTTFEVAFTIISLITLSMTFLFCIKVSKLTNIGSPIQLFLFTAVTFTFFNQQINILRTGMAVSFLLLFSLYLCQGKRKQTILFAILALASHFSALVPVLLFLLVRYLKIRRKTALIIYISSILISFIGIGLFDVVDISFMGLTKADNYIANTINYEYRIGFRPDFVIFNTLFLILFIRNLLKLKVWDYYLNYYILMSSVFFLWFKIPFSDRIGLYSWNFIPVLFFACLKHLHLNTNSFNRIIAFGSYTFINLII